MKVADIVKKLKEISLEAKDRRGSFPSTSEESERDSAYHDGKEHVADEIDYLIKLIESNRKA